MTLRSLRYYTKFTNIKPMFTRRKNRNDDITLFQKKKLPPPSVTVTPSIGDAGGSVKLTLDSSIRNPKIEWTSHGKSNKIKLNATHTQAIGVMPGRYSVVVVDDEGGCSDAVEIIMTKIELPVVTSYSAFPASGQISSDGKVIATVDGVPSGTTMTIMWSNGSCTSEPVLQGVPPGLYVATVVGIQGNRRGVFIFVPLRSFK